MEDQRNALLVLTAYAQNGNNIIGWSIRQRNALLGLTEATLNGIILEDGGSEECSSGTDRGHSKRNNIRGWRIRGMLFWDWQLPHREKNLERMKRDRH
jgi:hypothetical protein